MEVTGHEDLKAKILVQLQVEKRKKDWEVMRYEMYYGGKLKNESGTPRTTLSQGKRTVFPKYPHKVRLPYL